MFILINHGRRPLGLPTRTRDGQHVTGVLRPGERREVPGWYFEELRKETGWAHRARSGDVEFLVDRGELKPPAKVEPEGDGAPPKPPKPKDGEKPPKAPKPPKPKDGEKPE